MKKFLLATALLGAAGMFSSAARAADVAPVAESQVGFTGDIWGGYYFLGGSSGDADDSGIAKDFPAIGADASVIFGVGDAFLLQGTAQGALNFLGSADDDQMETGWEVTGHAMHGSGFGVFGGLGGAEYDNGRRHNRFVVFRRRIPLLFAFAMCCCRQATWIQTSKIIQPWPMPGSCGRAKL